MSRKIFKAVIPAAGRGTRMHPLTRVVPKEMFPLGRKPMIQLAVEEAVTAGVKEICIVIRKGKEITKNYLLHEELRGLEGFSKIEKGSWKLTFAQQKKWDGLGGALRIAKPFVGQDPFLMIIPDQLLVARRVSASQQLISQYDFEGPVVLSSMVRIPKREVAYFYGSRGFLINVDSTRLLRHLPVPITRLRTEVETQSCFSSHRYEIRGFGRTIFPPAIFSYLSADFVNPKNGEVDLWKTFKEFPKRIPHFGCLLQGRACDLGTIEGYYHYLPVLLRL